METSWSSFVAAVLAGALIQGIGEILVLIGVQLGLAAAHSAPFDRVTWATLLLGIGAGTFMVAIWQALYFQIQMMRRHRRAEAERWKLEAALANADLGALRAQLNPHFLFNCLNGLRALVVEDHGRAQNVITRLANVLRYSLQSSANPTVSLEQELQTVDDYLDLEAIRFEERLRVRREIDPATLRAQVPPMVVQTLVENAIKYGVAKHPGAGEIEITSRRVNGEVVVVITNTGQIEAQAGSTGLGLRNASDRLRRLLGPSASITLMQSPNNLVTAAIRIPLGIHPSVERDSVELGGNVGLATARRPSSTESRSTSISSL